ncbi:hypothetical protein S40285_03656 [Stachybotrys chlorohalonatus IBT 40285]|uniref:Haloacid dehalogenase, type II n=1 Tax=Stachybotrys chlorohalonatus (strain IBT 40285) TaxID=1283841 RepID=A0A084QTN4_STAC4|nr:hypothetical protein S40285_03656 [Stachybotrys chlorohalonata IBT 40285]
MASPSPKIKAVFFDFMGTCLDWHSSVVGVLPWAIPRDEASKFALEWRRRYFIYNSERVRQNLPLEDIDDSLTHLLDDLLIDYPNFRTYFDIYTKGRLIEAWHKQPAWPEVNAAIRKIRQELGLEAFVLGNGTTRLQLDLVQYSGLSFNMIFSSQLLGVYKPAPEAYEKTLQLVKLKPEEVVMVAAHAYDLRGAQKAGMKTIYIYRWTDDVDENMDQLKTEFDVFLDDMQTLPAVIADL